MKSFAAHLKRMQLKDFPESPLEPIAYGHRRKSLALKDVRKLSVPATSEQPFGSQELQQSEFPNEVLLKLKDSLDDSKSPAIVEVHAEVQDAL
ncbi:hypothetical protein B9Z55_012895 [Caenorhabditis nigoni]|uniref:Uncharacterized protein n=1 Tax=Caenorhabditis nigoni TaxID=1611254 RepID=A0A2G5TZE1_9PELO|nr:hypothetical protein B9Z55_012895 [Caenorhabditis nigoni]